MLKILRPSEVKTMAFCPRFYWFQYHLERPLSIADLVKIFRGIVLHAVIQQRGIATGEYVTAEKAVIGELWGWTVFGRADAVHSDGDSVVEIKTSKGPRNGIWMSDYMQALVYALVLGKRKVRLVYRNGERIAEVAEEDVDLLRRLLGDLEKAREGYFPSVGRCSKFCQRCPFRHMCSQLGEEPDERWEQFDYTLKVKPAEEV